MQTQFLGCFWCYSPIKNWCFNLITRIISVYFKGQHRFQRYQRTAPKAHKELHLSFVLRLIASSVHCLIFHFFFHFQQTKTTPIKLYNHLIKTACSNMLKTNPCSNQQCPPKRPLFFSNLRNATTWKSSEAAPTFPSLSFAIANSRLALLFLKQSNHALRNKIHFIKRTSTRSKKRSKI